MSTNRFGLDVDYQLNQLDIIMRNIDNYRPDEFSRAMLRLGVAADSYVIREPEFKKLANRATSLQVLAERKYGKTFLLVLKDFASQGYGVGTTAKILGYSSKLALQNLLRKEVNWKIDWPDEPLARPQVIRQIEKEFSAPFLCVVQAFANCGYTQAETSYMLGYADPATLGQVLRRNKNPVTWKVKIGSRRNLRKIRALSGSPERAERVSEVKKEVDRLIVNCDSLCNLDKTEPVLAAVQYVLSSD